MDSLVNVFGRDTPAGLALRRCYVGKKDMYSTYDPELNAYYQQQREEREEAERNMIIPKQIPKSKAPVDVPKVGNAHRWRPNSAERANMRLQAAGKKKGLNAIQETEADVNNRIRAGLIPVNKSYEKKFEKPARTDKEKDRLGEIFEYGAELRKIHEDGLKGSRKDARGTAADHTSSRDENRIGQQRPKQRAYNGEDVVVPLTGARRIAYFKINEEAKQMDHYDHLEEELRDVKAQLAALKQQRQELRSRSSFLPPLSNSNRVGINSGSGEVNNGAVLSGLADAATSSRYQRKLDVDLQLRERDLIDQMGLLISEMRTTGEKMPH